MDPFRRSDAPRLAFYITSHGYGHAIRSFQVIQALLQLRPDLHITLVTAVPEFLVEQNLGRRFPQRQRSLDVGMAQLDSLRFDLGATLEALQALRDRQEQVIAEEVEFLNACAVDAVCCDIPFLPFVAAERTGIDAIGLGNFTWDWIYREYLPTDDRWQSVILWVESAYRRCRLFLRLPMHGDCSVCPEIRPVPLIARTASHPPGEVRRRLGVAPATPLVLISFSDLDLDAAAQERLARLSRFLFIYRRPLRFRFPNSRAVDDADLSYADLVGAADAVITKPGYGIVADCLAHGTPMIYTDRGHFREYGILVREMERHLETAYVPSADLYAGRWETAMGRLKWQGRRRPAVATDGALTSARWILARVAR